MHAPIRSDPIITVLGWPLKDVAMALTSRQVFTYALKAFQHVSSYLLNILHSGNCDHRDPDTIEVVCILERTLKTFFSGSLKSLSRGCRISGMTRHLQEFRFPYADINFINLQTRRVHWNFWKSANEYNLSFGGFLTDIQKQHIIRQIEGKRTFIQLNDLTERSRSTNHIAATSRKFVEISLDDVKEKIIHRLIGKTSNRLIHSLRQLGVTEFFKTNCLQKLLNAAGDHVQLRKTSIGRDELFQRFVCHDSNQLNCLTTRPLRSLGIGAAGDQMYEALRSAFFSLKLDWFINPYKHLRYGVFVKVFNDRDTSTRPQPTGRISIADRNRQEAVQKARLEAGVKPLNQLCSPCNLHQYPQLMQSMDVVHDRLCRRHAIAQSPNELLEFFDELTNPLDQYVLLFCIFMAENPPENLSVDVCPWANSAGILLHYLYRKLEYSIRIFHNTPVPDELNSLLFEFKSQWGSVLAGFRCGATVLYHAGLLTCRSLGTLDIDSFEYIEPLFNMAFLMKMTSWSYEEQRNFFSVHGSSSNSTWKNDLKLIIREREILMAKGLQ